MDRNQVQSAIKAVPMRWKDGDGRKGVGIAACHRCDGRGTIPTALSVHGGMIYISCPCCHGRGDVRRFVRSQQEVWA